MKKLVLAIFILLLARAAPAQTIGGVPQPFNFQGWNDLLKIGTPATSPVAGWLRIYANTTGTICILNNLGAETCFGANSATSLTFGATTQNLSSAPATSSGQCIVSSGAGPYTWGAGSCSGSASTGWSNLANAGSSLTLANAGYASTFNQTSAVNWTWANTTAALVGTSQSSPIANFCGTAWHSGASATDCLTIQNQPGNGADAAITFAVGHTGSSTGAITTTFPGAVQGTTLTSTVAIGTAPLTVTSNTPVANLSIGGSAASLSISGQTGLLTFAGLTSSNRAKTVRDAADTMLELGGSYTPTGTWNWQSASVTWPTFNQSTSGTAATATDLAAYTSYSIFGSGNAAKTWITPGGNNYVLMSPATNYATTTPSFVSPANARIGLFPSASEVGDLVYCATFTGSACASWALLSGNTGGSTAWLQETTGGVPTWTTPPGSGTVTSSGSPVSGNIAKFTTATNIAPAAYTDITNLWTTCSSGWLKYDGTCTTPGGGGTVTASGSPALYDIPYWTTGTNLTKVTAPTSPNGVPQYFTSTPSGGVGTAPTFALATVPLNNNSETTCSGGTLNVLDRATGIFCSGGTTATFTLPVHSTSGFGVGFPFFMYNGNSGSLTITPTTDTIDNGTVLSKWASYNYNNSSGNWQTVQFPTWQLFSGMTTGVVHVTTTTGALAGGLVALASDVSGQLPIGNVGSSGLSGTLPISISSAGAISISTTPTFTSETLSGTTNQLVLGTTNTTTLNFAAPASPITIIGPTVGSGLAYETSQLSAGIVTAAGSTYGLGSESTITVAQLPFGTAAAGQIPVASNSSTAAWSYTPTLGDASHAGGFTISDGGSVTLNGSASGSCALTATATLGNISMCGTAIVPANIVVASSPSAGIGHFAGSTQTITSSAVVGSDFGAAIGGGTVFGNNTQSAGSPAFTVAPALGIDNSTAGTLQLANGSAAFHTILGSAAPANTSINFGTMTDGKTCTYASSGSVLACNTTGTGGSAFPVTVSGTVTSGGIPYFNSTTQESTSALLALNHVLLGGGAGGAPTSDANMDDGVTTSNTLTYAGSGGLAVNDGPISMGSGPPACSGGTAFALCGNEGTTPTGASSVDQLYADATIHSWRWNANNQTQTQQLPQTSVLHSNFTDANTTFATVSDGTRSWSWPVAASQDYYLDCTLTYQGATATSNSPNFEITGPSTPTSLSYTVEGTNGTAFVSANASSFSTSLNPFSTLASFSAIYTAHVYMGLSNGSNAGTVTVLAKNTTGTDVLTIYAGSTCRMQ